MKKIKQKEYLDRVYGSWLGRVTGDFVGAPIEFRPYNFIKFNYGNIEYYPNPIDLNYVNDDEMYEICALIALEEYGINLTSKELANMWVKLLYTQNFTAEKVALKNLRNGIKPPESGIKNNIYYDAIGAQMRADIWGQICPGIPEVAREYAEIDGCISHRGIGIEGEIFIAVVLSRAFFEKNIRNNIVQSMKFLPPINESLYSLMIEKAIAIYDKFPGNFRKARQELIHFWKRIRWSQLIKKEPLLSSRNIIFLNKVLSGVHVLPNIGIIILSLLYGSQHKEDQLGKSICYAAMMGLDTDCNCGNIGAILGAHLGAKKIPKKWTIPLQNTFSTYVKGYEKWKITELARRVAKVGLKVIQEKGKNKVQII